MPRGIRLALNHMAAPRLPLDAFFGMARKLSINAVEIRNDIAGNAIADGGNAADVRAAAEKHGLRIITINALQRFNDWTAEREDEAEALAGYAAACGAEAVILCPVNDRDFLPGDAARLDGLRTALEGLAAIFRSRQIAGLVEPLGFPESSLRLKREAVDAIDAVAAGDVLRIVHDTFHHAIAGEQTLFPERTGLVHVSGAEDPDIPIAEMRDSHRVLIGPRDRLDNCGQVRRLLDRGYSGFVSFEPFAESVQALPNIAGALDESIAYLSGRVTG